MGNEKKTGILPAPFFDSENAKVIEQFKFLLTEYGLEFDENLTEGAKKLKQMVLDALPPTMRKDAERIGIIKDKCHELRGVLEQMYPDELPDYARYTYLRDEIDEIEIYVNGEVPKRKETLCDVIANADSGDGAGATVESTVQSDTQTTAHAVGQGEA